MPSHPEMQAAFRAALAGAPVPPGITATGDLARRFSVYRNTVAHSLVSALAQRFPAVRRIVGPAFFDAAAGVFVAEHPPRTPLIHAYGEEFPDFLGTFPPAGALPYLRDVARIEVLRGLAYHAADAVPMASQDVAAAIDTAPDDAVLRLHPSLHVLVSDRAAVSIWRMNQPGGTVTPVRPAAEAALIFRAGDQAAVLPMAAELAPVADALLQGASLGRAAQDHPPEAVAEALTALLRHALIVDVTCNP